ncbi:MAG TPA: endonuclease/exonuclease/phosphatase family protein [Actinomycetota bacterium]|nr:endonuclease/exonuclease/phosphatase family protein [Actinomycetota bacterium]
MSKHGDGVVLVQDREAPSPITAQAISRVASGGDYFSPPIELTGGQPYCFGGSIKWIGGGWPFIGFDNYGADGSFLGETWVIGQPDYPAGLAQSDAGTLTPVRDSALGWYRYQKTVVVSADTTHVRLKDELFDYVGKPGEDSGLFDDLTIDSGPCPFAGTRYRFLQFNMAGSVDYGHEGRLSARALRAIARSVKDFRPAAVSLNEICLSQFNYLMTQLLHESSAYPMTGSFATTKTKGNNCEGTSATAKQYGIAVLVADAYWDEQTHEEHLLLDDAEDRKLACVRAHLTVSTRVCATHIADSDEDIREVSQIYEVARVVNPWIADGEAVVLMGDFNAKPASVALDPIYAPRYDRGEGGFLEVDSFDDDGGPCRTCGARTTRNRFFLGKRKKIDYIFLSENRWESLRAKVTDTTTKSDHRILRGSGVLIPDS